MRIDAHVHSWALARGDYDWLTPDAGLLYRDVSIGEVQMLATSCGISKVILVQAAPTVAETEYLLDLATKSPAVLGVVGWVDFAQGDTAALNRLAINELLVGLRPMLQDDRNAALTIGAIADALFTVMVRCGLVFDALVRADQIDLVTELASRHHDLKIVLDHGGKPPLNRPEMDKWYAAIAQLAQHSNVSVKLSGLMTETEIGDLKRPAAATVALLEAFGPARCLWGSDWPMLSTRGDYADWLRLVTTAVETRYDDAHDAIFGGNASRLYSRRSIGND